MVNLAKEIVNIIVLVLFTITIIFGIIIYNKASFITNESILEIKEAKVIKCNNKIIKEFDFNSRFVITKERIYEFSNCSKIE